MNQNKENNSFPLLLQDVPKILCSIQSQNCTNFFRQNANMIGPEELQYFSSLFYIFQEVLDTTNSGRPHSIYGLFRSSGYTKLTAIKSVFDLDIILVYTPCQIILDHGSQNHHHLIYQTSNPFFTLFLDAQNLELTSRLGNGN